MPALGAKERLPLKAYAEVLYAWHRQLRTRGVIGRDVDVGLRPDRRPRAIVDDLIWQTGHQRPYFRLGNYLGFSRCSWHHLHNVVAVILQLLQQSWQSGGRKRGP